MLTTLEVLLSNDDQCVMFAAGRPPLPKHLQNREHNSGTEKLLRQGDDGWVFVVEPHTCPCLLR
jgi:hypothetical protein